VITDGDLRRHMDDGLLSRTVTEIMHPNPKTIASGNLAAEALGLMNRFAITALFVVDEGMRPIGFLHMHDCLRAGIAGGLRCHCRPYARCGAATAPPP
jgi:arabinose-5-phosphate isomerase